MANSASNIDAISQSQASKEVTANAFFDAASVASTYGRRQSTCSGLTWGMYGGNVTLSTGALYQPGNQTVTLVSGTNYIVADKTTGAVSVSTATTNWNNQSSYWRLYSVVATTTVSSYTDCREIGKFTGAEGVASAYINIPQNSQSADYTCVVGDAAKHIFHPSADTTARTFTIPANASVAFILGTAITFINQNAAGVVTIAITTDTMRLAGTGATGNRTLAANGVATAIKITSTEWIISGTGLS